MLILGRLARAGGKLPVGISYLSYWAAVLLVLVVVTSELQVDIAFEVVVIVAGLVVPGLPFWLGHYFGRLARA